jgi:hypothetical protein
MVNDWVREREGERERERERERDGLLWSAAVPHLVHR